jgi:hypothetical protein
MDCQILVWISSCISCAATNKVLTSLFYSVFVYNDNIQNENKNDAYLRGLNIRIKQKVMPMKHLAWSLTNSENLINLGRGGSSWVLVY